MFVMENQKAYNPNPLFLPPKSVAIYLPQPTFFYHQHSDPYLFQAFYGVNTLNWNNFYNDNQLKLNKFLDHDGRQLVTSTKKYRHHKQTINREHYPREIFLKSDIASSSIRKKYNNSDFALVDLSNIKMLPPQEKLSSEELTEPRRKNKRWTIEEDRLLCELKLNARLNWRNIAEHFPTRTLKACQFRMSRLKSIEILKQEHQILPGLKKFSTL